MIAIRKKDGQDASNRAEVMVITSDPAVHDMARAAAKSPSFAVSVVSDSQSLLQGMGQRKPDLILLDFSSPDIDGMTVCRELKANAETKAIPVVVMLASGDLDNRVLGFQLGAADYLIKPLVVEEVTAKLGIHIKQRLLSLPSFGSRQSETVAPFFVTGGAMSSPIQSEQPTSAIHEIFDQLHDSVYLVDFQFGIRYANKSACQALGYSRDELLAMTVWDIDPYLDAEAVRNNAEYDAVRGFAHFETYHRRKSGHVFPVEISSTMVEYDGQTLWLCVVLDIGESRRIAEERQSHLQFFECMDRVNRAIKRSNDLEVMMSDVLDQVLDVFDCDRAYLLYPIADAWRVPMERTRSGYPAAFALGLDIAKDREVEETFRFLLAAGGAVTFGPGNQRELPETLAEQFGCRSMVAKALHVLDDKPWQFGIHQCSRTRIWTADEIKLFQAIGRRLVDGLSSMLAYRALQASEAEYRMLVENVPVSIARYDVQARIIYFNSHLEKVLQVTTAEVKGKRPTECFSDPYYRDYEEKLLLVAATGETVLVDWEGPGEDGPEVGVITLMAKFDQQGAIQGLLAIGQSFSMQRRIEAALKRSEALYASVVSAMTEGVIVQSREGEILSINPAAEAMLGLPMESLRDIRPLHLGLKYVTLDGKPFSSEQQPSMLSLKTGQPCFGVEMGLCRDDGDVLWISVNTQPLFAQGEIEPYAVVSTLHNITEKKRAESDRLQAIAILEQNEVLLTERLKLERRFSRMANHVPGFLYTFKVDANGRGRFVYLSSGIKDIYGLTAEAAMGDMDALRKLVHSEDQLGLEAAIAQAASNTASFYHEYRIYSPGKGVLWLEAKAMPTVKDDGSVVFHGFVQDITERKRMEATLKFIAQSGWQENRDTFLASLASFLGQMLEVDYVLVDELASDPEFAETVVVYRKGEILPKMRYQLAGTPCEKIMEGALCCYPERVQQQFPEDALLKDMKAESYAGIPLSDSAGNTIGLVAVMDGKPMADTKWVISILQLVAIRIAAELERNKFERALAESRQFLHSVINTIAQPVFVKNRRHRWILVNTAFSKLIGQPPAVMLGKSDYDFFPQAEADEFWARDEEVFRTGEEDVNEVAFTDRNGNKHALITKKTRYIDDNGQAVLVGIILDITERKKMEAMVRKREEEFRTLAENLPDIVVRYDRFFRRTYVNKVYSRMLEPLGIDLLGKTPQELWKATDPDAERFTGLLQKVVETGGSQTTLIQAESIAGTTVYWTMKLVPEFDQDGSVSGVLTCAADITELKQYQRKLEVSREQLRALASRNEKLREEERKHIARELHDDLGQRLTALKFDLSRLVLRFGQSNQDLRQQVEEMERDMGATIQIVRDVSTRLRPSALEMGIVSALEWLVQEFRKRTNISCLLRFYDKKLVVEDNQSIALFRIVQESLTNIMRYAMATEVEIALSCDGQYYWLEIRDNGVGFELNEKRRDESFGLIGIEERALSLGGDMRIETSPNQGLKLTVCIPASDISAELA